MNLTLKNLTNVYANRTFNIVSPVLPAIMFGTGVFGNCLALFVLARSSLEQKRTVFYRLVAGLAVADLFGIVATSPVTLMVYYNKLKWVGGQVLCNYFSFVMIFAGFETVFIVGAMATERYLALAHPYLYSANVSHKKINYVIIIFFILAFILAGLPLVGVGRNIIHYPGTWCFFDFNGTTLNDKVYSYTYASIGLLSILVLTSTNVVVIGKLIKMRRTSEGACVEKEVQMIIFLAGVVMIFTLCWAPLLILILINQSTTVPDEADLMAIRLASLNQILDPWVYILFRKELFVKLKSVLACIVRSLPISCSNCIDNDLDDTQTKEDNMIKLDSIVIQVNNQAITKVQKEHSADSLTVKNKF